MGQLLRVVSANRLDGAAIRFEVDRSLSGMGIETYASASAASGSSTCDVLAGRLLALDGLTTVSIFSNIVTVTAETDVNALESRARAVIEDLFTHYVPGVEPTPI